MEMTLPKDLDEKALWCVRLQWSTVREVYNSLLQGTDSLLMICHSVSGSFLLEKQQT